MRRKSTAASTLSTYSEFSIKNTGLRPSWDAFWALEEEINKEKSNHRQPTIPSTTTTASVISKTSSASGITVAVKFVTGSEWIGEWDKLGMCGTGTYKMPHGVIFEGAMNLGLFEGIGVLKYPNGGSLEGFWHKGKLKYCQYVYADGLKRDSTTGWPYCITPDRRFYSELQQGLKPADTEQSTNEYPTRELPPGHYDVGDGFYNPHTKCVIDSQTGEILRIPTVAEEKWIFENCRAAEIDTVGYRPDLYQNWFEEQLEHTDQEESTDDCGEILKLVLQEGGEMDSASGVVASRGRSWSLQSKIDYLGSLGGFWSRSSVWSRSTIEVETYLKNLVKDLNPGKLRSTLRSIISLQKSQSGSVGSSDKSDKFDISDFDKKITESSVSAGTKPFTYLAPYSVEASRKSLLKYSSRAKSREYHSILQSVESELLGSKLHYTIDYSDFDQSVESKLTD